MKKKLISLVASLSLAFSLSTAFSKDASWEEKRVEQYRQFYKEYHDKDYKIKKSGVRMWTEDGKPKTKDLIDLVYGNNIYDNTRSKFTYMYDSYMPYISRQHTGYKGPDSSWYFMPYKDFTENREAFPLESLDRESLPQVMKDILTLPEDLQKQVFCVNYYSIDGDSWIMFTGDVETETINKIYGHLSKIANERNSKTKEPEGQIQPIIPTENQLLPLDIFFPPVRYVDENNDGVLDYVVELYSTNGSWFDPNAEVKYITLTQWFELEQSGERKGLRKHEKPFKITIDFDLGKDYEQEGFDIIFYDKDHDTYFENYELIKK